MKHDKKVLSIFFCLLLLMALVAGNMNRLTKIEGMTETASDDVVPESTDIIKEEKLSTTAGGNAGVVLILHDSLDTQYSAAVPGGVTAGVTAAVYQYLVQQEDLKNNEDSDIISVTREVLNPIYNAKPQEATAWTGVIYLESQTKYVSSWALNVRSAAGTGNEVIGYKNYGNEVTVIGQATDDEGAQWGVIQLDDNTYGYVYADYLVDEPLTEYLGEFTVTYYCTCPICCGYWSAYGKTASGSYPTEGRTIATDPSIPFGTRLIVDGVEYVVEDRGGSIYGNKIDVYMNDHWSCLQLGVKTLSVYKELD